MRIHCFAAFSCVLSALLLMRAGYCAEPPPPPPQVLPEPISAVETGFAAIFDGKSLRDWDGNPTYWRVEQGAIVGETTDATLPKYNSFIIWRGGRPADFELKLEYRISPSGNSAVQYRSSELDGVQWVLRGYQCDIDGAEWGQRFAERFAKPRGIDLPRVTGQNYEERGRAFLALPGQLSYATTGQPQRVLAMLADARALAGVLKENWNRLHMIVRGNQMIHIINDRVISVVIDDDVMNRRMEGLLGFQVHEGPPMKVEFRNIRMKSLGEARP